MSTCRRAELKYLSSLFLAIEDELEHDSIFGTNDIEKREENLKEKRLETRLQNEEKTLENNKKRYSQQVDCQETRQQRKQAHVFDLNLTAQNTR